MALLQIIEMQNDYSAYHIIIIIIIFIGIFWHRTVYRSVVEGKYSL